MSEIIIQPWTIMRVPKAIREGNKAWWDYQLGLAEQYYRRRTTHEGSTEFLLKGYEAAINYELPQPWIKLPAFTVHKNIDRRNAGIAAFTGVAIPVYDCTCDEGEFPPVPIKINLIPNLDDVFSVDKEVIDGYNPLIGFDDSINAPILPKDFKYLEHEKLGKIYLVYELFYNLYAS